MNDIAPCIRQSKLSIRFVLLITLLFASANMLAQVVPITNPTGGFEIEGNLESNNPTVGAGDWVPGNAGTGGFVLNNTGIPVDANLTTLVRDAY